MAKAKKRLSKKAKEALKVLEKSKLMGNSKTTKSIEKNQADDAPTNSVLKNNVTHKPRPNKKRG